MTDYTIVGDEQPGSTENKHFLRCASTQRRVAGRTAAWDRRSAPPLFGHALAARAPHGRAYRPFQCRRRQPEPAAEPWPVARSQSQAADLVVSDELPRSP